MKQFDFVPAVAVILGATLFGPTYADTCAAGSYPNDDGKCTLCEPGYYCPDGLVRRLCTWNTDRDAGSPYYSDTYGATECTKCPDDPDAIDIWYWISNDVDENRIHPTKFRCRAEYAVNVAHGFISFSCTYGNNGYRADESYPYKCASANAIPSYCDAGYAINESNPAIDSLDYGGANFWFSHYDAIYNLCTPAEHGYYSPANTILRTKCPSGTDTRTDTATSPDDCEQLCTAGATTLHVGSHQFNIWPDGQCGRPAINLGLAGGRCCVNLDNGANAGLNIDYGGTTYHAVN